MKPSDVQTTFIGRHNQNLPAAQSRIIKGETYKDLSTVCIIPAPSPMLHFKVVQCWMSMMTPMNQRFMRIFVSGHEVGEAYNTGVEMVLNHPELSKWRYLLTLEHDNMPPPDGLLKLYEGMKKFDVIGGLYWTKGEGGQPMIYGDPHGIPKGFQPQLPQPDCLQECNGLGMGFNLFKLSIFKKMPKPWFKTLQEYVPGQGGRMMTQDLYFYEEASKHGFRFACDTRIKVGHFDAAQDIIW